MEYTFAGWLHVRDYGEAMDVLMLDTGHRDYYNGDPLAKRLQDELDLPCTASVRYYITKSSMTLEQAQEAYIRQYYRYGDVDAKYIDRYSEITGYLWTDEELNVGGHDLLSELRTYGGKYLILVVEVGDTQ
ncbi:hypothetical protein [Alicyclobacillus acidoterrestris]|uniref:Uncharacterized protein n=1 Tax=Alicyclobacillus acidoterrestris (strain ATCC 49025 / DSM 3922 / CIP 106132 / NCIMB 13137 / GD3B) TaxID=1356854 RepID=T0D876_ALIAG|nr:hypothetical protein [Alicyclobacillus acidoterrestris]EPZ47717.1 hypothetical protein N007_05535 [Alicyclobacillus acidoterrestris ATCC 49025]UNO47972.1 hypothetical protein K1I37_14960 [Alicyclobacillus acidoterrestris]